MPGMPKNYGPFLHELAAAHACTELAAFDVETGPDQMRLLYYATGPGADKPERVEAAVKAFKDIIAQYCLPTEKDGVIQVVESPVSDRPQFCLVTLARRAGKVVGAGAFIKRFENDVDAKAELKQIQHEAERFRTGPPSGTAG
jgi:hypothetical protein